MTALCNKKAFSLIETLVVCVIVGILAAVSIPMYIGYVKDQRQTTVNNLAETAAASANAYLRRTGNFTAGDVTNLGLYYNSTKYPITVSGNNIVVNESGTSFTAQRPFQ